jgi:hypothetical protein
LPFFPSPSRRLKFYSGLFSEYPDFFSGNLGDSGKKCGVSGLFLRTFSPETPETPGKSAEIPDFPVRFA